MTLTADVVQRAAADGEAALKDLHGLIDAALAASAVEHADIVAINRAAWRVHALAATWRATAFTAVGVAVPDSGGGKIPAPPA